ncbi:hypothetical protein WICPIJ_004453 [Wickerhamomyces pijperi]|uniref:Uncharacterized protein n=1 Tax=Wickerhamomyces pijperi TaxID=599730 RepID=A0A9P8Q5L1_WICPI|nr:hypothetical protein WICPIJ_004453 [Wickerhamomyces pijperi]
MSGPQCPESRGGFVVGLQFQLDVVVEVHSLGFVPEVFVDVGLSRLRLCLPNGRGLHRAAVRFESVVEHLFDESSNVGLILVKKRVQVDCSKVGTDTFQSVAGVMATFPDGSVMKEVIVQGRLCDFSLVVQVSELLNADVILQGVSLQHIVEMRRLGLWRNTQP